MIAALERLALARSAKEFDELTVSAAETVRALLADRRPRATEGQAHFIEA
jgi:hypothetical protein